jgi:hypothetical protein
MDRPELSSFHIVVHFFAGARAPLPDTPLVRPRQFTTSRRSYAPAATAHQGPWLGVEAVPSITLAALPRA